MSIENRVNGVMRNSTNTYSKVNGVWRNNTNAWSKVNGIWRNTDQGSLSADDIIGFKMIYTKNASRIYHDNPRLKYNANIPHSFNLTGESIGNMDFTWKGVVFEFMRERPEEEGIMMYEGRLYAVLQDNTLINVCQVYGNNAGKSREDEMVSEFNTIHEVGILRDIDVTMTGYVLFEDYGFYFSGWNNIFNTKPFVDQTIYPDKFRYKKRLDLNSYNILPVHMRDEHFDSVSAIGVARDMETSIYNMQGSHGILDHTITNITLNGVDMPFVIEIK